MNSTTPILPSTPRMILLEDAIYRELAELARIECETASDEYVRIEVETTHEDMTYILNVSAILTYGHEYSQWSGSYSWLRKIQPTWVELHTYDQWGDEYPNDFDIQKLKSLI